MSNHVKILARCDFSLWRRQRHKTYLPIPTMTSASCPRVVVQPSPLARKWYCILRASVWAVDRRHYRYTITESITEKEARMRLQHASLSQQINPNRREDHILGQQQHQLSIIEWTWVTFEMPLWLSPSVLRRVVIDVVSSMRVMCVALYPWDPIIWQNAFYDEWPLSDNN